ncbi:ParB family protein [Leifsonia poae]|uniref:ParB family protein n=1 Tax=Leifsonia poae TaxID=110933 RepID=UPI001CBD5E4F|nr:hypothetical protein [Leifsonia poae]
MGSSLSAESHDPDPGTSVSPDAQGPVGARETASEFRAARSSVVGAAGATGPMRRTTITFYITEGLRDRARGAYRATSFFEQDSSWSEMLNKALLAEVERRERAHNAGERFAGNGKPLAPGRPIGF